MDEVSSYVLEKYSPEVLWIVIVGFLVAFILAFGIGANDVANSFGTSVGSKVLTIRQACILATVFEILGAVLIGYKVSDTVRKGIFDLDMYKDKERELMLGFFSSLCGSAVLLIGATFLKLPVSGTHSIVGATVGFSLVLNGFVGIHWETLLTIVASWFISPILSGTISVLLFVTIRKFILESSNPLRHSVRALPFFYGGTIFINVFSIVHDGPELLLMNNIPTWIVFLVSLALGLTTALAVQFFFAPRLKKKILAETKPTKLQLDSKVNFTCGDTDESSRESTPKKSRPVSLIVEDEKVLPVIKESTEISPSPGGDIKLQNGKAKVFQEFPLNGIYRKKDENVLATTFQTKPAKNSAFMIAETNLGVNMNPNLDSLNPGSVPASGQVTPAAVPDSYDSDKKAGWVEGCGLSLILTFLITVFGPIILLTRSIFRARRENRMKKIKTEVVRIQGLSPNSSAVPLVRPKDNKQNHSVPSSEDVSKVHEDPPEVNRLFSFLQILTATFGSFAHGGNDVSNAIGPLIALYLIYVNGEVNSKAQTPIYILFYGGVGISIGLWLWGRRVIETIGEDLTKITASTGFTIEIGAAFTVLMASKIGLPISTTHCKVGSVVFVGWASSSKKGVDWKLFRNIISAWVVTVPLSAGLSAAFMALLKAVAM